MQQPGPSEAERIHKVTCAHAESCLTTLQQAFTLAQVEAVLRAAESWSVLLIAFPTPKHEHENVCLTDCEQACLGLLAQLSEPIPGLRACAELERRGLGIYGEATVKRALARLKNLGLIANARTKRRGYYLPESSPLHRRLARL
jgi:hypothetical protein